MSQRKYNFVPGEFYHIYNRGTDKRTIFLNVTDYQRFQVLLYLVNSTQNINIRDLLKTKKNLYEITLEGEPLVAIGAYCLMPNHFHLLLTPLVDEGISLFMQKLATSYSMYFNNKYERTGSLFQGKFRSELATDDRYLKYLFSYIHLNPVKLIQPDWKERGIMDCNKTQRYLEQYDYSSYLEITGKVRPESMILDKHLFPVYFKNIDVAM